LSFHINGKTLYDKIRYLAPIARKGNQPHHRNVRMRCPTPTTIELAVASDLLTIRTYADIARGEGFDEDAFVDGDVLYKMSQKLKKHDVGFELLHDSHDLEMTDMTNLKQLDDNKWRIRFKYKERLTGTMKPVKRVFEGTLAQARAERDRLKVEARNGGLEDRSPRSRVKDWMPSFAEHRTNRAIVNKRALRHTTLQRDHAALSNHILPEIEDWVLTEIRPADIDDLIGRWRRKQKPNGKRYARASVNTWIKVLKLLLRHCFDKAGLGVSPAENTSKLATKSDRATGWPRKGQGKGTAMTRDQQARFLEAARAKSPYWYTFFLLGFTAGARLAGLTALRWKDVDWESGELLFVETQVDGIRYRGDKSHRQVSPTSCPAARGSTR
jgi:hypothetical protein